PTVFLNHFPLGTRFYGDLAGFPIIATLSGHWHSSRVYQEGDTVHYNTPTLCFGGIDQSPRGYRLCSYRNGALRTEWRALGVKGDFKGIGARPHPENVAGRVTLLGGAAPRAAAGGWPLFG